MVDGTKTEDVEVHADGDGGIRFGDGDEPKPGDLLGGRFLLRRLIGSGASGDVFVAQDTKLGRTVALKLLRRITSSDQRSHHRLRREFMAAQSGHPNIVAVYDLHTFGSRLGLSMQLVKGRSLSSLAANPEVKELGRVAVAAALLANDRADEALLELGPLIDDLRPRAAYDFHDFQVRNLARGIFCKALLAAGQHQRALIEARELIHDARPGLLPDILAQEVVHELEPSTVL